MTTAEMKTWLAERLKREVTVSQVNVKGVQGFMVDYFNHAAPATKLVGANEEEAVAALFSYLSACEETAPALPPVDSETSG